VVESVKRPHDRVRLTLIWVFTMFAFTLLASTFGMVLFLGLRHDLWREAVRDNFAALILLPISCGFAMVLVLVLRVTEGQIEFKILGLEFRGASGQLVFWVLVFLVQILAIRLLWNEPPRQAPAALQAPQPGKAPGHSPDPGSR
jgi:lysylphosphatidylglycerol synthetase-like protein (DUF2156 family)